LRQVQLVMIKSGAQKATSGQAQGTETGQSTRPEDRSHPFYWASFIQSGDWRNLDGNDSPRQSRLQPFPFLIANRCLCLTSLGLSPRAYDRILGEPNNSRFRKRSGERLPQ